MGLAHPGHKPDARYYNTMYQDMISYLKTGQVRHGEWFYNKQRLRGGHDALPLPQGFTEMDPSAPFPRLDEVIEELDGSRLSICVRNAVSCSRDGPYGAGRGATTV